MKTDRQLLGAIVVAAVVAAGGLEPAAAATASASLVIQADRPGPKVSPTLYGIFFEEINCAGDGGLYAEMVRNRSFEDSNQPDHWLLVTEGRAKGEMAVDRQQPMSEKNQRSLQLTVTEAGNERVGAANDGYWGMSLKQGQAYELSLSARAGPAFRGPLTVSLESRAGKVYARKKISGLSPDWKPFKASLTPEGTDPAGRLVLSASQPATIWLDQVSLFPRKTWKGRANGLRPDLAEMLQGLRPGFVRFPGGCWVEGDTLSLAYRWKQTIGDLAERRNQYNIWQYYSTHGLGFHEYLQMCEDLAAEPLFVINCGMSHQENVPLDQLGPWVQDALDAIEYANGPRTSQWGALRAKHGHPAPFNLKYMEIGNENGGPPYRERYPAFYKAIKAKYPAMRLVADEWGGIPTNCPIEIVDEHYYNSAGFFIEQATRYDTYERNGPKVYVGEYAVTQNCGQGNLRGALGEAAFMTGLERNSDVVIMASYAPLFANVNYKRWNPDLINFNSSRVYGTPSYYVQKMFAENRGDVVLPAQLQVAPLPEEPNHGGIGLGTWDTQAEYKDIKVMQGDKELFSADAAAGLKGWRLFSGDWQAKEGALQQTAGGMDRRALAGDPAWRDYTLTLKARKLGGAEGFLILFHVQDDNNWLWWNVGGWGNTRHAIEQCVDGGKSTLGRDVGGSVETGRWYDLRVELKGPNIRCFLDGQQVHDATDSRRQRPLHVVAGRSERSGEIILKAVNVSELGYETEIRFEGVKSVRAPGQATVLTSPDPADENSMAQPMKVAPVQQVIQNAATNFRHTFPAHSVTVLRVKAER
ncbi:MAG: alpha-L-arabinofuranosidase C-terminal domain-containing protein [Verrucomicrobiota bacterium]|jgi:alpha-L-arabinofuranosidase